MAPPPFSCIDIRMDCVNPEAKDDEKADRVVTFAAPNLLCSSDTDCPTSAPTASAADMESRIQELQRHLQLAELRERLEQPRTTTFKVQDCERMIQPFDGDRDDAIPDILDATANDDAAAILCIGNHVECATLEVKDNSAVHMEPVAAT
ncbi:hypothetical protein ZHAS_00006259 [Anopheles sinensis]|uniref:Uncharacterized protein n=1 Tax=Anopheles sinensis TaxID=74873 RepID=A0A084VLU2_ANOSI|nr:hypothetical protein ZHAS_00006259 [Anopheles sinensis]